MQSFANMCFILGVGGDSLSDCDRPFFLDLYQGLVYISITMIITEYHPLTRCKGYSLLFNTSRNYSFSLCYLHFFMDHKQLSRTGDEMLDNQISCQLTIQEHPRKRLVFLDSILKRVIYNNFRWLGLYLFLYFTTGYLMMICRFSIYKLLQLKAYCSDNRFQQV